MKWKKGFSIIVLVNTLVSIFLYLVQRNVPKGSEVRTVWKNYLPGFVVGIWIMILIVSFIMIWRKLKWLSSAKIRVIGRMAASCVALIIVCKLVEGMVFLGVSEDPESRNQNGTLTVKKGVYIEELYLYKDEGVFYRKAIRPMRDLKDTDPKVTKEEYFEKIRKERLEKNKINDKS